MTDEEFAHYNQLRRITEDRKRELEKQAAAYGPNYVPAHLKIDLKTADEELARIESKMKLASISPVIRDATGPEAGLDVLRVEVKELSDKISTALRWMMNEILTIKDENRQRDQVARDWRSEQDEKRRIGVRERRIIEGVLAIGLAIAIYLALR